MVSFRHGLCGSCILRPSWQFMGSISSPRAASFYQMLGRDSFLSMIVKSHLKHVLRTMLRDEKQFGPKTDEFRPERYFEPGIADPLSISFGFGRRYACSGTLISLCRYMLCVCRVCPGRTVAEDTIFLATAAILKLYSISLARDADGNEIPVEEKFSSGFTSFVTFLILVYELEMNSLVDNRG